MAFAGGVVIVAREMRSTIGRAIGKWRLFKEIEPGHRFQTRYNDHRQRRERGETPKWVRLLNLVGGPALIVAGFLFVPTPGPSYIIIVIGLWMLAGEFLPLARFFDRAEVRLRELGRWVRDRWSRLPAVVKVSIISASVAALGYGAYYLVFGG
jgi:Putative transmembrane protein (PGPGW)